jgi:hypothetical protein
MDSPQRTGRGWRWWIVGYALLIGAVAGTMFWLRHSSVPEWSSKESISDWQKWRSDVESQQDKRGPVKRDVPKSEEPPALVLMRDFFGVMLAGALLFTSMLYWILAWFLTGIWTSKTTTARPIDY